MEYKKVRVNGLNAYYLEAGDSRKPTILLLHGIPATSFMFRDLMERLQDRYHLVAPDYPDFGQSSLLSTAPFGNTFDCLAHLVECFIQALGLNKISIYLLDYGIAIGFRVASHHPEWFNALIVQNGNHDREDQIAFWNSRKLPVSANQTPAVGGSAEELFTFAETYWQKLTRTPQTKKTVPYTLALGFPDPTYCQAVRREVLMLGEVKFGEGYSPQYPYWLTSFQAHQAPPLRAWKSSNYDDNVLPPPGTRSGPRNLPSAELYMVGSGQFVLEEDYLALAWLIDEFLTESVGRDQQGTTYAGSPTCFAQALQPSKHSHNCY